MVLYILIDWYNSQPAADDDDASGLISPPLDTNIDDFLSVEDNGDFLDVVADDLKGLGDDNIDLAPLDS